MLSIVVLLPSLTSLAWSFSDRQVPQGEAINVGSSKFYKTCYSLLVVLKQAKELRVGEQEEIEGPDVHEHGTAVYSELYTIRRF